MKLDNKAFINLTPHEIIVYDREGKNIISRIPPSGQVARVIEGWKESGEIGGVPIVSKKYHGIEGIPEDLGNKYAIVSILVLMSCNYPRGFLSPDTGPDSVVRDEKSRILGVRRFQW